MQTMTKSTFSKTMRINGLDMPLLRSWNLFGDDFYKDVTPTALGNCRAFMTGETIMIGETSHNLTCKHNLAADFIAYHNEQIHRRTD